MSLWYLSGYIQCLRHTVSIGSRFPWRYCFQSHWFQCIIIESGIFLWWVSRGGLHVSQERGISRREDEKRKRGLIYLSTLCVPEISSTTDRFFFVNWGQFCPFTPVKPKKIKILKKWKKHLKCHLLTYVYKKSWLYSASWGMESDRHNFLSFWAIFCPFTPLLMPKIKMWKKCKQTGYIILLHINEDHMMYGYWNIRHDRQSFVVILGHFLTFEPPNNTKTQNLKN